MKTFLQLLEATQATIYTQSSSKGATVNDSQQNERPVMLNIDDIVNYEPAGKMQQPKSQKNMQAMIDAIQKGQQSYFFKGTQRQITPILVRQVNNLRGVSNPRWNGKTMTNAGGIPNSRYKYQVVDGHHRYWAYKAAGVKQILCIIIAPENIRKEKIWTSE
jgi:ParB/Sulfiredoxin domain